MASKVSALLMLSSSRRGGAGRLNLVLTKVSADRGGAGCHPILPMFVYQRACAHVLFLDVALMTGVTGEIGTCKDN